MRCYCSYKWLRSDSIANKINFHDGKSISVYDKRVKKKWNNKCVLEKYRSVAEFLLIISIVSIAQFECLFIMILNYIKTSDYSFWSSIRIKMTLSPNIWDLPISISCIGVEIRLTVVIVQTGYGKLTLEPMF